ATAEPPLPPEIAGRAVIAVGGTHSGTTKNAERDLKPLRKLGPLADTFAPKPYLSVQGLNDEAMAWGKRFYMKGAYLAALTDEAMRVASEQIQDAPGGCEITRWGLGGRMPR